MVERAVCAGCSHPVDEGSCRSCRALLKSAAEERHDRGQVLLLAVMLVLALLVATHLLA